MSPSLKHLLFFALVSLALAAPLPCNHKNPKNPGTSSRTSTAEASTKSTKSHAPQASLPDVTSLKQASTRTSTATSTRKSSAARDAHSPRSLKRTVKRQVQLGSIRPPSIQPLLAVWWAAADTNYYNPRIGGGLWQNRVSSLTSQAQRNLQCGDVATFLTMLETSPDVNGPISATLTVNFDGDATGKPGLAYEYIGSAMVSLDDPATKLTSAVVPVVTLTQSLHGTLYQTANGEIAYTEATIKVTDMQPGDVVVVRINARISCMEGGSSTGVLQAKMESALGSGVEVDKEIIHGGTIPLKLMYEDDAPADDAADVATDDVDAPTPSSSPDDVNFPAPSESPDAEAEAEPVSVSPDTCDCDFVETEGRSAICLEFVSLIEGNSDEVKCQPRTCQSYGGFKCVDGGRKKCSKIRETKQILSFLRIEPDTGEQVCDYRPKIVEVITVLQDV